MKRDLSPEEARDEKVYELTDRHYEQLCIKLLACDGKTIVDVAGSVARDLTDDVLNQLVVVAEMNYAEAGFKFRAMVRNVLLADARAAALREVEQLEQQRKQSQDEAKVDRAVLAQAMNG